MNKKNILLLSLLSLGFVNSTAPEQAEQSDARPRIQFVQRVDDSIQRAEASNLSAPLPYPMTRNSLALYYDGNQFRTDIDLLARAITKGYDRQFLLFDYVPATEVWNAKMSMISKDRRNIPGLRGDVQERIASFLYTDGRIKVSCCSIAKDVIYIDRFDIVNPLLRGNGIRSANKGILTYAIQGEFIYLENAADLRIIPADLVILTQETFDFMNLNGFCAHTSDEINRVIGPSRVNYELHRISEKVLKKINKAVNFLSFGALDFINFIVAHSKSSNAFIMPLIGSQVDSREYRVLAWHWVEYLAHAVTKNYFRFDGKHPYIEMRFWDEMDFLKFEMKIHLFSPKDTIPGNIY